MVSEITNGAAEITWQINLLVLCFTALQKDMEIMYLVLYLQGREQVHSAVHTKTA